MKYARVKKPQQLYYVLEEHADTVDVYVEDTEPTSRKSINEWNKVILHERMLMFLRFLLMRDMLQDF